MGTPAPLRAAATAVLLRRRPVGGVLLPIGLFTRPVAFLLAGEMAVGYFIVHAPLGFFPSVNGGDAAILFCSIFLDLFAAGPGT